jgi:hypothetical protein
MLNAEVMLPGCSITLLFMNAIAETAPSDQWIRLRRLPVSVRRSSSTRSAAHVPSGRHAFIETANAPRTHSGTSHSLLVH